MPVIHLEYTDNLAPHVNAQQFLKEAHVDIAEQTKAALYNCKSRVTVHKDFIVGDGAPNSAFALMTVKLIKGRTQETKDALGEHLLAKLESAFSAAPKELNLQFGCHIADYQNYFKKDR